MIYKTDGCVIHVSEPDEYDSEYEVQASKTISGGRTLFAHARSEDLARAEKEAIQVLRKRIKESA